MAGVPDDEVTAPDFMMVRAALVRRLGGANEAIVWARIHFRCSDGGQRHVDDEGGTWWPASSAQISEEVGLSEDQVDRALKGLKRGGFVDATEHRLAGNYDRTKSWRPLIESRGVDSAKSRNGAREIADRTPRNRGQDPAISRNVPSTKNLEEELLEGSSSDAAASDGGEFSSDVIELCDLLAELIRANGNKVGTVGKTWWLAADRLLRIDGWTREQAEWVMRWSQADEFWQGNILSMSKFRHQFDQLKARAMSDHQRRKSAPERRLTNAEQAAIDYQQKYGDADESARSIQAVGASVGSR